MKKLLLLLLLIPSLCWGEMNPYVAGIVTTCTTPTTGDELNEGFIGTGYENTWSETNGTATIDEDHTLTGTPLSNSCSEGFYADYAVDETVSYTVWDNGSSIASLAGIDIYIEIMVVSYTLPADYNGKTILSWDIASTPTGTSNVTRFGIIRDLDDSLSVRTQGANNSTIVPFTEDVWHTVRIHLDTTAANSYVQVDSDTPGTFTSGYDACRYLIIGMLDASASVELEYEIGRIWIDTP